MRITRISSLILTGVLLGGSTLAMAEEQSRYTRQELEQQRQELRIQNQGEDSQIRNRFNDTAGKGDMIRQRSMDGSSLGGGAKFKGKR